jgi:hypothetical protein
MHRAGLTVIAIPLILLAAMVAISSTVSEDAYARDGRYSGDSTSQAASVSNDCFNPIFDSNEEIDNAVGVGNCGGTISQQDESGSASAPITSQTANPTIELQRATTTTQPGPGSPDTPAPETCEECFAFFTPLQLLTFSISIMDDCPNNEDRYGGASCPTDPRQVIDFLCNLVLDDGNPTRDYLFLIIEGEIGLSNERAGDIIRCIQQFWQITGDN